MALDESVGELEKLESNGIDAYVDPSLLEGLKKTGEISIDYVTQPSGDSGYIVRAGGPRSCGECSC